MYSAGVVGATGFAGAELVSLLDNHPRIELAYLTSRSFTGQNFSSVYPRFAENIDFTCQKFNPDKLTQLDIVFLAVPHGVSQDIVPQIDLENTLVVDLAADYRFSNVENFEQTYDTSHADPENVKTSVYGLSEYNYEQIQSASLVANPGCYATAALVPLVRLAEQGLVNEPVFIDAKSGISGAGREPKSANSFVNCNEEIKPYKVGTHRHQPEITAHLPCESFSPLFVPHVISADRGIEAAIYFQRDSASSLAKIKTELQQLASEHELFRYREKPAGIKAVARTPYCDFTCTGNEEKIIVFSCIDNLLKGASSQALQNANLMLDLEMTLGLLGKES